MYTYAKPTAVYMLVTEHDSVTAWLCLPFRSLFFVFLRLHLQHAQGWKLEQRQSNKVLYMKDAMPFTVMLTSYKVSQIMPAKHGLRSTAVSVCCVIGRFFAFFRQVYFVIPVQILKFSGKFLSLPASYVPPPPPHAKADTNCQKCLRCDRSIAQASTEA